MAESETDRNPVEELAEEFAERFRRGECPALSEYVEKYPQWATEIRRLFPALVVMERARPLNFSSGEASSDGPEPTLQQLGDFRILREIGRGGMGIVYEAEQESLGRRVALKVLSTSAMLDVRNLRRFEREAKAAARLHHTNIVPVYGVGEEKGLHYFVMQFIPGQGLDQVLLELRRLRSSHSATTDREARYSTDHQPSAILVAQSLMSGPLPATAGRDQAPQQISTANTPSDRLTKSISSQQEVSGSNSVALPGQPPGSCLSSSGLHYWRSIARVGVQVAEALAYAHSQGVLHRDIKPSNLLLDTHGAVWVADFGLAKAAGSEDLTHTGDIVGTLRYMAPERFTGRSDIRSDIYGLGLTLYELLTLQSPFLETDRHQLIQQVTTAEPPHPRRLQSAIPQDLETIVLKAIAREPDRRYQTPAELSDDLKRYLEDRPIHARRLSYAERLLRWCRRYPSRAAFFGLLLCLGLAIPTGSLFLAHREREWRTTADEARQKAEKNADDNRQLLVRQYLMLGERMIDEGDLAGSLPWLVEALRRDGADPKRAMMHRRRVATVWQHCAIPHQIWFHDGPVWDAKFSPNGRLVATACHDGTARLWDATSGGPVGKPMQHQSTVQRVAFSPNSSRLVTTSWDGSARVWDAATAEPISPRLQHQAAVRCAVFSPDGSRLITGSSDQTARIWDPVTGETIATLTGHQGPITDVAYSPDGRLIATASVDKTARIWDAQTGQQMGSPLNHSQALNSVAFSFDSTSLVTTAGGWTSVGEVRVWNASSGLPRTNPLSTADNGVLMASFSPDDRFVVAGGWGSAARIWDVSREQLAVPPLEHGGILQHVEFSADGRRILTAGYDKTARVWDWKSGRLIAPPLKHTSFVLRAAFSPDGQRVLTVSWDHTAKVWDLSTAESRPLLRHSKSVLHVEFSHDGRRIVTSSNDHTARVWDAITGKPVSPWIQAGGPIHHSVFSPDDSEVLTASADKMLRRWSVVNGKPIGSPFEHQGEVNEVVFSSDGRRIVTASADGTAQVWDAQTGERIGPPLKHARSVTSAHFSHDASRVVTSSLDNTVKVWNATTGEMLLKLVHASEVLDACFSPDDRLLATAVRDDSLEEREAQVWNATTGDKIGEPLRHGDGVLRVNFSPDSRRVITASEDNTARIWDAATGRPLTPPLRHTHHVWNALFSHDGTLVATASYDGTARVWDAITGEPVTPFLRHRDAVSDLAFSPDDCRLATTSLDNTVLMWDLTPDTRSLESLQRASQLVSVHSVDASGELVPCDTAKLETTWRAVRANYSLVMNRGGNDASRLAGHQDEVAGAPTTELLSERKRLEEVHCFPRHAGQVRSVSLSFDGSRAVSGSTDNSIRVWDLKRFVEVRRLAVRGEVSEVVLSADATRLLSSGRDAIVRLWEPDTGECIGELKGHTTEVHSADFSPDGSLVVSGGGSQDPTIRLWEVRNGQQLHVFTGHTDYVWSVAFSPDGKKFLSGSWDKTVRLWDVASRAELKRLEGHTDGILKILFCPDGRRALSCGRDKTIRLWDLETGTQLRLYAGHEHYVEAMTLSANGRWIASGGYDQTLRIWDLESGEELASKQVGVLFALSFSADGKQLVSGGEDGFVRLWRLNLP